MKLLLLFYGDQFNPFQVLVCSWNFTLILWWSDKPVSSTIVFMKLLLLFYDHEIYLFQLLVCSWNIYSYFMMIRYPCIKYYFVHETFTLILWWSDIPVSSTIVFMKILLLFYGDQLNPFQVLVCSWNFTLILWWSDKPVSSTIVFVKLLLLFYDDQINLLQVLVFHESFTLILWWTDKPVSITILFMKHLLLFYEDQINLFQELVCSWKFYSYFMMIRYPCFKYYFVHETFTLILWWSDIPVSIPVCPWSFNFYFMMNRWTCFKY